MDGCLSRCTPSLSVSHTHTSHPIFSFMGLLPNATFGPNYQVVSISWTSSRFPSVKLLMRFGLATVRLSICLLTLPFCLSGTRRETGSPHPGNRAATGKDAMFYPTGVHSTNPSQRLAVPSGAKRNLLFPSDNGRKNSACVGDGN